MVYLWSYFSEFHSISICSDKEMADGVGVSASYVFNMQLVMSCSLMCGCVSSGGAASAAIKILEHQLVM